MIRHRSSRRPFPQFIRAALVALSLVLFPTAGLRTATAGEAHDRLLIIAPQAFHPALQDFLQHKQKQRPTDLVTLERVLRSSPGVDDPERLKRFLFQQWHERSVGYVLLVGDVDVMPVRYMVLDRVTPAAKDYAFYPSDLYYSDLAKADGSFDNWNAQTNSFHAAYFGEVRGEKNKRDPINYDDINYLPDIAVGRWPVSTPKEVRLVAEKTIRFEKSVLAQPLAKDRTAGFVAVGGWVDSRGMMRELASKLGSWHAEKRFYGGKESSGATPPTPDSVRGLFNSGAALVVHTGHGQPDGWDQCLGLPDLDKMTNSDSLPVVISAGCSTAYFAPLAPYGAYVDVDGNEHKGTDNGEVFSEPPPMAAPYQKGRFNPTGLGEQMLKRNANGAVAYIGCNTGSQPCGLTLVEGFVSALAVSKTPHLGDCWAEAIRHYYRKERLAELKPNDDWYPPSIFFQGMKFMLFGDPSLQLPENGETE
jgi:hypothetical protein